MLELEALFALFVAQCAFTLRYVMNFDGSLSPKCRETGKKVRSKDYRIPYNNTAL